ncbi:MAG: hypothetical protein IKX86_01420 [Clostridia bacterium]|nr:hypothetical protein [Clostridia bacterium]MBR5767323.1 hypothetical protein [Clostridia bacterium]
MEKNQTKSAVRTLILILIALVLVSTVFSVLDYTMSMVVIVWKTFCLPIIVVLLADSYYTKILDRGKRILFTILTVIICLATIPLNSLTLFSLGNNLWIGALIRCGWIAFWSVLFIIIKGLIVFRGGKSTRIDFLISILLVITLALNTIIAVVLKKWTFISSEGVDALALIISGMMIMISSAFTGSFVLKTGRKWIMWCWLIMVALTAFLELFPFSETGSPRIDLSFFLILITAIVFEFLPCPVAYFVERKKVTGNYSKWYKSTHGAIQSE